MHKVVVERPRWNPGGSKNGRRANLPDELLPKFEGIKRPHVQRKGFRDLLGPLERWLQAQAGRPWNDVYSEACAVIKPDSVVRAHVKTHLLEYVERHTFMHDGQVCAVGTCRGGGIRPVGPWRYGRTRFYVHPETGLLHELAPMPHHLRKFKWQKQSDDPTIWLNDRQALKQIKGLWYFCQFKVFSRNEDFAPYDHATGQVVDWKKLGWSINRHLYCFGKRQLSRRELRQHNLKNQPDFQTGAQSSIQIAVGLMTVLRSLAGVALIFAGRRRRVILS